MSDGIGPKGTITKLLSKEIRKIQKYLLEIRDISLGVGKNSKYSHFSIRIQNYINLMLSVS